MPEATMDDAYWLLGKQALDMERLRTVNAAQAAEIVRLRIENQQLRAQLPPEPETAGEPESA